MAGRKITIEFLGNSRDLVNAANDGTRATSTLGDKMKKFGKIAAIGLAAGAVVAGKALFDMTKNAMADEAAQAKLANALKNTAGATDKQIASVEDWISAQGTALGVTDDELRPAIEKLTQATGDITEAQKLAALAMDASAARGKSLEVTSKALADAEDGRMGGLKKLGIETENAAGKTLSLDQIHKNMAATFKGAAATSANTLEGKMGRLKLILSEAGETIGSKLIPVVTKMADWFLKKALPAIQEFGAWLGEKMPPIFEVISRVIKTVLGQVGGTVSSNMGSIKETISSVVSIIRSLWDRFGSHIVSYMKTSFENAKKIIGGVLKVISGIFKVFSSLLKGDWKGVWDGIKKILSGAWDIIVGLVKQALNLLKSLFKIGWTAIKGIVSGVWDGIKSLASKGLEFIVDAVKGIPGKIRAVFGLYKDIGKGLIGALLDGISKAGSFAADFAGKIWDAIKSVVNSGIDKLNDMLEFSIKIKGIGFDVNMPDIGHLAKGTNNWRGGLTVVGEEGPELVNLPRGSRVTPHGKSMGALSAMGGGTVINIYGALDPVAVARQIETILIKGQAATGQPLRVRTI